MPAKPFPFSTVTILPPTRMSFTSPETVTPALNATSSVATYQPDESALTTATRGVARTGSETTVPDASR